MHRERFDAGKASVTGRVSSLEPRPQYLPPQTPEARAVRAALQDAMATRAPGALDLTTAEKRAVLHHLPRHPATSIGE